MPRRKKTLSPHVLFLLLFFAAAFLWTLASLPSNEDSVLNSSMLQHMDQNPPEAREMRLHGIGRNQSIVFVHVGKTGGETIQWRIKLSCKLRRNALMKEECFEHFQGEESFLSQATVGYLHCDKLKPKGSLKNSTAFMVSIRNPIDRIISWFQYMHLGNCVPNRPSAACNLKKDNSPWGINFYKICFPVIDDFVKAMVVSTVKGSTGCSALALETVQGRGPEGPSNHMYFNYFYYANATIYRFPHRNVLAVRQEMLWDDLRSIESYLGGDPHRPFERQGPTITHGSEQFRYRASLDPKLVLRLCCAIPKEIETYKYILERAVNLDVRQKSNSLKGVLSKCGAVSIDDLRKKCTELH